MSDGFEGITLRILRDTLHERLLEAVPDLKLNGHSDMRLPNTLNVSFPNITGRKLLKQAANDVAASLGSACHEESDKASGVLGAMGLSQQRAQGAVRFSVGVSTSIPDIEWAASTLVSALCECGLKSACHIPDKNKLMSNKQIYPH